MRKRSFKSLHIKLSVIVVLISVVCTNFNMEALAAADSVNSGEAIDMTKALGKSEGYELLENGNFENGIEPWKPKDSADLEIVYDAASDSNCLLISNRTITPASAKQSIAGKVISGNFYKFSVKVKYMTGPDEKYFHFSIANNVKANTMGYTLLKKGEWGIIEGTYEFPEDMDMPETFVYIETPWTGEPSDTDLMDFYIDEVTFMAVDTPYVDTSDYPSLKELYKDYFKIGVSVTSDRISSNPFKKLIREQFNSMTLENEMKPGYFMNEWESTNDLATYKESVAVNFNAAQTGLEYASANDIQVRGHVLVWHGQTPDWFFYEEYDTNGEMASRDLMLKRMENYIKAVIEWTESEYPGVIYAWDVVNEAINENDPENMRDSLWVQTIGTDFVEYAFKYARKYAPEGVKLFYNDYGEFFPVRRDAIIEMLKPIVEAGNIDGVGMQSHINTGTDMNLFMRAVKKYAEELEVEIHITELDIVMPDGINADYVQGDYYYRLMRELIKAKDDGVPITSVSFWGVSDGVSWIKDGDPLLFSADFSRKLAFEGVLCAIERDQLEEPERYELIENGGFEDGLEPWTCNADAKLTITEEEAYSGSKSLLISERVVTPSGPKQDMTLKINPGGVYRVSAKVKYVEGVENKSFIFTTYYKNGADDVWYTAGGTTVERGEWGFIEGTWIIPEDADISDACIFIESQNPWIWPVPEEELMDFYVDDISIIEEINKNTLFAEIKKALAVDITLYTKESGDILNEALVNAQKISGSKTTQKEINAVTVTLQSAINDLEIKEVKTHTVKFNANNGEAIKTQNVESGSKVLKPSSTPERQGYNFKGWYAEGETEAFDFENTEIKADITIIAKWERKEVLTPTITLKTTSKILYIGQTFTLEVKSKVPSTDTVTFTSNKTDFAPVNSVSGKVTAKKVGTAIITATTSSGVTATCNITVKEPTVTLKANKKTLEVGGRFKVEVKSKTPSSEKVTFTSDKPKVATVNKLTGQVIARAAGTAKITATMTNGGTKICTIKVNKPSIVIKGKTRVKVGGTLKLNATAKGVKGLVTWSVDKKKLAVINKKGKLTAKAKGNVTVTAKIGKVKGTIKVKIS